MVSIKSKGSNTSQVSFQDLTPWSFFLVLIFLTGFFPQPETPESALRQIPVQSGGRVKPFESFAEEALLSVSGKRSLKDQSATLTVWDWIAQPDAWYTQSFLPTQHPELQKEWGLMVINGAISPELVLTHPSFQEKVSGALAKQEGKESLTLLEKKRIELYDRARLFQAIAQGSLPGFFPDVENPKKGWMPLAALADPERRVRLERQYSPSGVASVQAALGRFLQAEREEDGANALQTSQGFDQSLKWLLESRGVGIDSSRIHAELSYNQVRPFKGAWILYLASALLWFFLKDRWFALPLSLFGAGFGLHTLGFTLRSYIVGRPPVSNMYESVIWVGWAAVFFALILGLLYRKRILVSSAAWVGALTLLVGESFPALLDPSMTPLVPVLRSNYWLTVHVLTITLSYGAFALAWGLAHANLVSFAFRPKREEEQKQIGEYLYRALQIGVVLLAAGTILGGVWANASWGRFWGWDPKETWALIALLGYLAVLHGRFAGWLGTFGTALGSILAFLGILMAWYGVNFVLAAGLHSYGFGGGGFPYVLMAVGADLILVSFLSFRYYLNLRSRSFTKSRR